MSAVPAMELCENVEQITQTCGYVYDHHQDQDKADELLLLLASVRDAKQAIAEVYDAVQKYILSLDTPRSMEVVGLGLVERKRYTKRSQWDHDAVRSDLVKYARANDADPLDIVWSAMRPSWRVTDLRGFGLQPDEYCVEEVGAETIVLPSRPLDERGKSWEAA